MCVMVYRMSGVDDCGLSDPTNNPIPLFLPGEDGKLGLDDLDPDDDEQKGADDQHDELQKHLKDGVGEPVFTQQDLPQCVQQQWEGKLGAHRDRTWRDCFVKSIKSKVYLWIQQAED